MTAPRVTARPTHNLTLSDGSTTLGLTFTAPSGMPDPRAIRQTPMPKTALQTTQGDADYSALQLPYVDMTQKDWSGGRGWAKFSKDPTRYYDGKQVDTTGGDIILGPLRVYGSGIAATSQETGAYTTHETCWGWLASKFTAAFANVGSVEVVGAHLDDAQCYVAIHADGATPGAQLAVGSVFCSSGTPDSTIGGDLYYRFNVPISATLTPGTNYWLAVGFFQSEAGVEPEAGKTVYFNSGGGGWTLVRTDWQVYYKIKQEGPARFFFFEYKGSLYCVRASETSGTAPRIYRNGYQGTAASNAGAMNKLKIKPGVGNPSITENIAGKFVRITSGPGYGEQDNWRKIVGYTTTEIEVSPSWNTTHVDTTTTWAVTGVDFWTEVTGHGLTKVTSVLVVDDIVYFAQGDDLPIRKMRFTVMGAYEAAGTPNETDLDATYKGATFLAMIPDTAGTRRIWAAQSITAKVYNAPVVAWNTQLTWAAAVTCGNPRTKITNCLPYGNPQAPFILKEEGIGSISWNPTGSTGVYAQIPLTELATVIDYRTGRAACQYGVYLFLSFLDGLERFYDNRLDDMGLNKDEGLPTDRQGPISSLIPYPGGILASVDAGPNGYSAVYFWNQLGWAELYRASTIGARIHGMYLQTIPDKYYDMLWFNEGDRIAWIPMSINPRKQIDYEYVSTGEIVTPWYTTNFAEINKFWRSMTFYTENLEAGFMKPQVQPYYQIDNAGDLSGWVAMPLVDTSPVQEIAIKADYTLTGKRIRFKLVINRGAISRTTPRIIAWTVSSVVRIPPATSWSITILAASYQQNQQGRWEAANETTTLAKLKEWANSKTRAAPLTMRSEDPAWDNKMVFIDPTSIMPISLTTEANAGKRTVKALSLSLVENEPV